MPNQDYFFGWKPDLPDIRDKRFKSSLTPANLPAKVDLSTGVKTIYNQGQTNSCTANAIAAAFEYGLRKQNAKKVFNPSRFFIYYNEREMINETTVDRGAYIRDGIKSVNTQGVCNETEWPFDKSIIFTKPANSCYLNATKNKVSEYLRLDNTSIAELKSCLAEGFPFVFGFSVYSNFNLTSETGILELPDTSIDSFLGGHAVLAIGYDDANKTFIVLNSYGDTWGSRGYFTIPYNYLTNLNLADDFWTIRLINQLTLTNEAIKLGKCTVNNANVRDAANASGKILRKLKKNIKVDIFEELGGWYRIDANKSEWISASLIEITKTL